MLQLSVAILNVSGLEVWWYYNTPTRRLFVFVVRWSYPEEEKTGSVKARLTIELCSEQIGPLTVVFGGAVPYF